MDATGMIPRENTRIRAGDYTLKIEPYRMLQGGNRLEGRGRARDGPLDHLIMG